jgi:hypothetical protein
MMQKPSMLVIAAVAVAAFSAGALFAGGAFVQPASAQGNQQLPPIFQVGNTVTYGPQGHMLTILQIWNEWIFVEQDRVGGFTTDTEAQTDADTNNVNRFWVHVPAFNDSWRMIER